MSETPMFPWVRRPAARALASARAIGAWRRWLVGSGGRAGTLRRLASWLRVLTAPPPALLEDEPLGILPALLGEVAGEQGGTQVQRTPRVAGTNGRQARPRAGTGRVHSGTGRRRRSVPSAVLTEQAADGVALPRAPVSVRRPLPAPTVPERGRKTWQRPAVDVTGGRSNPTLAALVGKRAVRRLVASAPPGTERFRSAVADDRAQRKVTHPAVVSPAAARAVFDAQWSASLAGRAAPPELLGRLSERDRNGAADLRPASPEPPRVEPPELSHLRHESAYEAATELESFRGRSPLSGEATAARDGHATAPADPVAAGSRAAPTFAPTPPIGPVPHAPGPEPLRALAVDSPAEGLGPPVEAATRLRRALSEDAAHAAELQSLAAMVKRILDEEARRHGIDV